MAKKFSNLKDNNNLENDSERIKEFKKFFITTPIYYATDAPHLGSAYTTIAADTFSRFQQTQGINTYFITGTDEHGAKVAEKAKQQKKSNQNFVDEQTPKYSRAWSALDIEYDQFVRTTDPNHKQKVSEFMQEVYTKGFIKKGKYEGIYCTGCEEYKSNKELVDELCPIHKIKPIKLSEPAYFFNLSDKKFIAPLKKWVEQSVFPIERRNEVLAFIDGGLEDVAISRKNVRWGIDCPWDKEYTLYVWIDALLNYWSFAQNNWPPDLQLMAKDILRFHCVIWPAILLAYYDFDQTKLPRKIFVHGFFTLSGEKMSKSLGNIIDPLEIVQNYGASALRYYLLTEVSFGSDGDISLDSFVARYNAELSNDLGNLVQRILTMAEKFGYTKIDRDDECDRLDPIIKQHYSELEFSKASLEVFNLIRKQNALIDEFKPWVLTKTDPVKCQEFIGRVLLRMNYIGKWLLPMMPQASSKLISQVNFESEKSPLFPKII